MFVVSSAADVLICIDCILHRFGSKSGQLSTAFTSDRASLWMFVVNYLESCRGDTYTIMEMPAWTHSHCWFLRAFITLRLLVMRRDGDDDDDVAMWLYFYFTLFFLITFFLWTQLYTCFHFSHGDFRRGGAIKLEKNGTEPVSFQLHLHCASFDLKAAVVLKTAHSGCVRLFLQIPPSTFQQVTLLLLRTNTQPCQTGHNKRNCTSSRCWAALKVTSKYKVSNALLLSPLSFFFFLYPL